jgi:hypothetical protein
MREMIYRSMFSRLRHYLEVNFMLRLLYPQRKELPLSIGWEDGCNPEPVWMTWRRENA